MGCRGRIRSKKLSSSALRHLATLKMNRCTRNSHRRNTLKKIQSRLRKDRNYLQRMKVLKTKDTKKRTIEGINNYRFETAILSQRKLPCKSIRGPYKSSIGSMRISFWLICPRGNSKRLKLQRKPSGTQGRSVSSSTSLTWKNLLSLNVLLSAWLAWVFALEGLLKN